MRLMKAYDHACHMTTAVCVLGSGSLIQNCQSQPANKVQQSKQLGDWGEHPDLVHPFPTRLMAHNQVCVCYAIFKHSEKVQLWPADIEAICLLDE